jgi:hypothetical protein
VADHDDLAALFAHAGDFEMHLGDQRAGGVEDAQAAGSASLRTACETPWALKITVLPAGTRRARR